MKKLISLLLAALLLAAALAGCTAGEEQSAFQKAVSISGNVRAEVKSYDDGGKTFAADGERAAELVGALEPSGTVKDHSGAALQAGDHVYALTLWSGSRMTVIYLYPDSAASYIVSGSQELGIKDSAALYAFAQSAAK